MISFSIFLAGCFCANLFLMMIVRELNERRQESNAVSYVGWTFPKVSRVFREYREINPTGRLAAYSLTGFGAMVLGLVGTAIALGFFG